ncbi:Atu4866 domain-containing protein [Actinoplanes sp. NPDC049596]|uniref:Atu4866 domain-containing protein n=1 Tax=unclassified Actinoplanes TaxID=2626549 RepID=UPI0034190CF4
MRAHPQHVDLTVLDTAALLAIAMRGLQAGDGSLGVAPVKVTTPVGSWLSADGTVRLEIRTDGTYAGSVAGRKQPARGTYRLDGATMTLRDESGLRTPVTVGPGVLEMAGHRLGRAGS